MSSSPRILIADSDEIVVAIVSHLLQRQGYAVDIALSSDAAAQRLEQNEFNAIVIDSKLMPALEALPDGMGHTIILGNVDVPAAHAVLRKPLEFSSLIDTVAACVK